MTFVDPGHMTVNIQSNSICPGLPGYELGTTCAWLGLVFHCDGIVNMSCDECPLSYYQVIHQNLDQDEKALELFQNHGII